MDDPVPREAALNMAIDETLLAGLAEAGSGAKAILRVYRWRGPVVSIGYFDRIQTARGAFPTSRLVRRWTGGGIVEHGRDFTYSVLVPRALTPGGWPVEAAYRRIHQAVADALRGAGIEDDVILVGEALSGKNASPECFRSPVLSDVLLDGHKIGGAAQRRSRHGLLHQGSVQEGGENDGQPGRFAPGSALHTALSALLPTKLAGGFVPRQLTPAELDQATKLAARRYAMAEWLERV